MLPGAAERTWAAYAGNGRCDARSNNRFRHHRHSSIRPLPFQSDPPHRGRPGRRGERIEGSSRLSHKPHIAGETVKIFYRFHPLCGQRATKLGHRSHRGEPVLMVADPDGRRYFIPRWMTDPKSADWAVRDVPRLSRAAMSELHGLVAMILRNPVPPETGGCDETSKTEDPAEEAAVRAAAADQPAASGEGGGRLAAGGPDRGGDAATGPDAPERRRP